MNKITTNYSLLINKGNVNYIDLKKEDIYTLSLFEELQQQSFAEGMDYYICVVRQNDRNYLFDASRFIEHCIREQKIVANPFTQQPIENFEIHISSKEDPDFKLYMENKEVMTPPNHLPILWTDASKKLSERLGFMLAYGKSFENKDIQKTIKIYEKAYVSLSSLNTSTKDLFACAYQAEDYKDYKMAFKAYTLAAERGNLIGLVEVIDHLERGVGVEKNLLEAAQWRQQLPEGWREASTSDFFNHLKEINYNFDQTGYPL